MNRFIKLNTLKTPKLANVLLKIFVALLVSISIIVSGNILMEYLSIQVNNQMLAKSIDNKTLLIDELKFYLNTTADDQYKERIARLLGYYYPDETIYYIE